MTASACPEAALETIASALRALGIPAAVRETIDTLIRNTTPSRASACVPARDDPPSEDKIRVDRDSWVKLKPTHLEDHPMRETLEDVMAQLRPDVPVEERWKILRDFAAYNIRIASEKGLSATARKMRDFIGWCVRWEDRLQESIDRDRKKRSQRISSAVRSGAKKAVQAVSSAITHATQNVASRASLTLTDLTAGADHNEIGADSRRLQEKIGESQYEARVAAIVAEYGCSRWRAQLAVHAEASRADEL